MPSNLKQSAGFTLVELIMIMVIIGILSATAFPRFADNSIFQSRGFADQVLATLRYAQKTAIAQHRLVCASLTSAAPATVTLTIASSSGATICSTALNLSDRASNTLTASTGITLSSAVTVNFDALGRVSSAATTTVSGTTTAITVEAETGYVHQ